MRIEKADIAGWRIITDDKTYYVGEYYDQGVIYKDMQAFKSGVGVCYINEYGFDNCEQNSDELFELSKKMKVANDIVGNPYVSEGGGYTREDFDGLCEGTPFSSEELFDSVSWEMPETQLEEWFNNKF